MLKEEVLKTIKTYNLIEKNDKVVIGVSGGPDSICLLHLLYSIKKELGFNASAISKCCRGVRKQYKQFKWKFYDRE